MACRMLCLDCGVTGFAETRLEGSDGAESLGWLLGGLPGWLYCAWRHALRTKACAACGSAALARETRTSAAEEPCAAPASGVRVASRGASLAWPLPLRDPRARLRAGGAWTAAWALVAAGLPGLGAALASACVLDQLARQRASPRCRAWDADGRALHIELA
jgi:hypothetical protein